MISFQANNLSQNLLLFHWSIAGDCSVAPQDEGDPTSFSFLYVHYAVGNQTALQTTEDNVSLS
jgi:hypothetical protein